MNVVIELRQGTKEDLPSVLDLIKELAAYEHALDQVTVSLKQMEEDGFGDDPVFEFIVAVVDHKIVGMVLYFQTYSTWKGRVLYLEDFIITQDFRRRGIGKLLFNALVRKAQTLNAQRLCWQVLDWNKPAIGFYKQIQAKFDGEWLNCKLTAQQIQDYKF